MWLTRVSGCTLADVVLGPLRLEAYAVLAVVVLAGRRLRVQHRDHRGDFAELAREVAGALAHVGVDTVHARSTVLEAKHTSCSLTFIITSSKIIKH